MNELLFLLHIVFMIFSLLISIRIGKSALCAFLALCAICANFFILKQISFFSLTITSTDVYAVGAFFAVNLLQEFYGKKAAKKATYLSFFLLLVFLGFSQLQIIYTPSLYDTADFAYKRLLATSPRIVLSSLLVFFLSQRVDIAIFAALQRVFPRWNLSLRLASSQVFSQLFDTILFSFLALKGSVENLLHIVAFSFSIKCIVLFLSLPFTFLVKKRIFTKAEDV